MADEPAKYLPLEGAPPQIWHPEAARDIERGLRQLAIADHVIRTCEACDVPIAEERQHCDNLCRFLTGIHRHLTAGGAPHPLNAQVG